MDNIRFSEVGDEKISAASLILGIVFVLQAGCGPDKNEKLRRCRLGQRRASAGGRKPLVTATYQNIVGNGGSGKIRQLHGAEKGSVWPV